MFKETHRSLRRLFGIVSLLHLVIFIGSVAAVLLALKKNPAAHLSPVFVGRALFMLAISMAFAFAVARFGALMKSSSGVLLMILNACFWSSVLFAAVLFFTNRSRPNLIGLAISTL